MLLKMAGVSAASRGSTQARKACGVGCLDPEPVECTDRLKDHAGRTVDDVLRQTNPVAGGDLERRLDDRHHVRHYLPGNRVPDRETGPQEIGQQLHGSDARGAVVGTTELAQGVSSSLSVHMDAAT